MAIIDPRCIYCGRPDDLTRDHYVPRAFGTFRGCQVLGGKLCGTCNELTGKLDEAFVRTGPNALFRAIAGVHGRSSHTPLSPFYYGLMSGETVKVLGKHPEYPFDVLWEVQPGLVTRELRQVIFRLDSEFIQLPLPGENILRYLREAIRQYGLEGPEVVAFFGGEQQGDAEYVAILEAIKAVTENGKIVSVKKGASGHVVPVSSALDITRRHQRTVTKVTAEEKTGTRSSCPGFAPPPGHVTSFPILVEVVLLGPRYPRNDYGGVLRCPSAEPFGREML
ncbi:MAG: hypothetical protein HY727_01900 [Candidatus Rokubacteria bacterium]|nr:hypothetical protein [Candidatus Rokubacteria bacterium]